MSSLNTTLIAIWICMPLSLLILFVRLTLRLRTRPRQPLDAADIVCAVSIPILLARWSFVHVIAIWGTNNVTQDFRGTHIFGTEEIYHREVGAKLTLAARVAYCSFVWSQKCVLLLFYQQFLPHTASWAQPVLLASWAVLGATFVAVQTTTFTECRPFHNYWQVLPDPGRCTQAVVQLLVLGSLSILTDVMLMALPIPVLVKIRQPARQKLNLTLLFSVGLLILLVTAIRLPQNLDHSTAQPNRTTWVSIEILASTFVANAPTIYGLLRLGGRRREEVDFWTRRASRGDMVFYVGGGGGGGSGIGTVQEKGEERESEETLYGDSETGREITEVPVPEAPRCYLGKRGGDVAVIEMGDLPSLPVLQPPRMTHVR